MKRKVPQVVFRPLFKKKIAFLHIPKTGGTALKNALGDQPAEITVFRNHSRTLLNTAQPICFVLRDPLERFCSGFWERKHSALREAQAQDPVNRRYARTGYSGLTVLEQQIFDQAHTPDQLISLLRTQPQLAQHLAHSGAPLELLTRSLTFWLGTLSQYQEKESQVHTVINMHSLTDAAQQLFGVDLCNQTDFARRSCTAFGLPADFTVSSSNQEWFKSQFRAEDYELVSYIERQPYFYTS